MDTMSWKEIVDLLRCYKTAVEEEDEETIVKICNVLPDEIRFYGDDIHIVF